MSDNLSLSKRITSFFSKLLLVGLAATFVLWGIGDVFRAGGGDRYVAKVGETVIGPQEYRQELNLRLNAFRRMLGESYSNEMVMALGIPQQVLNELIQRAALALEVKALNIHVPEEEIYKRVMETEAFQGADGFDANLFKMALQNANIAEEKYVQALEQETASRLLMDRLNGDVLISEDLVRALYEARNQRRSAKLYQITADSVQMPAIPEDKQVLVEYYQANSERYKRSEYRQLQYITFAEDKLAKAIEIPEEELRALYEEQKENYEQPEKRKVKQLLYAEKEEAIHALEPMQNGETMADVAKKIQPLNQEISLGDLTRGGLIEEAQEEVFTLAEGEFTNPIETSFGWHIFQVEKIMEAQIPAYEELKAKLLENERSTMLEDKIYDLSIELEDKAAAGETMDEIAGFYEKPVKKTEFFNDKGDMPEGNSKAVLPPLEDILKTAFGEEFQPTLLRSDDGEFYFIMLGETIPSSLPDFADVEGTVILGWQQDQMKVALQQKAEALSKAVKEKGEEAFSAAGVKSILTGWVVAPEGKKSSSKVPSNVLSILFDMQKEGDFSKPVKLANGDYMIAELTGIRAAKEAGEAELQAIRNRLQRDYEQEIRQQFMTYLQTKYPVEMNRSVLQSLIQ